MRFCQSFMMQLYRYIGSDTDIPSGDLGVGEREIGFLYGEYKRLTGRYESNALTGKGTKSGGSEFKKEAAGCGAIYFLQRMLADNNDSIEGKTIAVSGFGNLAWGVCRKAALLGAKVVTLSGPDGYIYDPAGIGSEEKLDFVLAMRASKKDCVEPYADRFGVEFFPGEKPWGVPVDIAIPCAVQNEVDVEDAVALVGNRVKYYAEASTMATTTEAFRLLELSPDVICAGAKAAGSGGVILSALEMVQNSQRLSWSRADVDERLHKVIDEIYDSSVAAAEEYGLGYDLIGGNNIASFLKVSEAMIAQAL
jgi:glutamate dehydrogenase (NADP+)